MALAILDGTQTATTLSTILSSGQHITAHTVVSLGTQAITDMRSAVSGSVVSVSSLPAISGTVTAMAGTNFRTAIQDGISDYVSSENFPVNISSPLPAGTNQIGSVTANIPLVNIQPNNLTSGLGVILLTDEGKSVFDNSSSIKATLTTALPAGTNRIGVVTIGAGTVTIGAGTAQIGSVTASISGTVPISISSVTVGNFPATQPVSIASVTVGNSVTIGSLPAISGTVTANIAISSSAITSGVFSSLTSATLVPSNTARKMATVYNLGPGQLFVNAGASATTLGGGFMVALSSSDYLECDYTTTTLSALFASAGTASWVSH